jgi:hypothetical protein
MTYCIVVEYEQLSVTTGEIKKRLENSEYLFVRVYLTKSLRTLMMVSRRRRISLL